MVYPGATPEEIEESIVVKIEDQVSGLDDVKAVKSVAAPSMASVRIQMDSGTDMAQALDDIESARQSHTVFPSQSRTSSIQGDDQPPEHDAIHCLWRCIRALAEGIGAPDRR